MSLSVRIDAEEFIPTHKGFAQTVTARNIWSKGTKTNVLLDQYTGVLMCKPLQFVENWESSGYVMRYPLSSWYGDTTHWDDVYNSSGSGNGVLNSDSDASTITTISTFDANTSFYVSFYLCGSMNDKASGIELKFGQWTLTLSTTGDAKLERDGITRYIDIITDPIADQFVELVIMPYVQNSLLIRRINGNNSGMLVSLTVNNDLTEFLTDPVTVISAGTFSVTPKSVTVKQFSLTELTYDTGADFTLISPVLDCVWSPTSSQTMTSVDDGLTNYGGALTVAIWEEVADTPFVPDGTKHKYRAAFNMIPLLHKTPMARGLTFGFEPDTRASLATPAEVSDDVRSIEINVDKEASQTEAIIELRNPGDYNLFGACSRLCTITIDGNQILRGILAEPPQYTYTDQGDEYYTLRVSSFYRYIQIASIVNEINFAGMSHPDAMGWVCYLSSLASNDIVFEASTDIIPVTTSADGQINTDWTVKPFDSGETWVKKICEQTGWVLTDGISGGSYVLKYVDPLAFDDTSKHTYHFNSNYETGTNQRIHSWSAYSIEPECNEFHLLFCNESGERCDAVYYDNDSANPSASPRPTNWLGFIKRGGFDIGQRTETDAQALSLRIGADLARRIDMARFTADWPSNLWVNDVVTIIDDDNSTSANYRIVTMGIKSISEISGDVMRTADILAEKVS